MQSFTDYTNVALMERLDTLFTFADYPILRTYEIDARTNADIISRW